MKVLPIQKLVMNKMEFQWHGVVTVDDTVRKGLLVTFTASRDSEWYSGQWIIGVGGHIRQVGGVGGWVDHRLFFK